MGKRSSLNTPSPLVFPHFFHPAPQLTKGLEQATDTLNTMPMSLPWSKSLPCWTPDHVVYIQAWVEGIIVFRLSKTLQSFPQCFSP